MDEPRRHGYSPFSAVVLHGGPGAPGSAQGLAAGLGTLCGVLEPFQTENTVEGLLFELNEILQRYADRPVTMIGHSWGAWLGFLFAARYPESVRKLILVSSGPFEDRYVPLITKTRMERMGPEGRSLIKRIFERPLSDAQLKKIGVLVAKADAFDPLPEGKGAEPDAAQYQAVWGQAQALRTNETLLGASKFIRCPVTAIHGDWDPHPAEGVKEPLEKALKDFRFILLEKCGHEPWKERFAKDAFFKILKAEV
jgi:pimeloyl-ACP methyl ester carboxylesterase